MVNEQEIRDLLVRQLQVLDADYTFIDKEKYLPSKLGTKSFIDILARDRSNRFVIIELKRSDAASREAIHELYKYLEALKENMSVRDDEVKLVVVSTEWTELLVPYSSFCSRIDIAAEGYLLKVRDSGGLSAEKITLIAVAGNRLFSTFQTARYYRNGDSLMRGVANHKSWFEGRSVMDFVLVILKAPDDYAETVIESTVRSMRQLESTGTIDTGKSDEELRADLSEIGDYQYMIYSANQLLAENEYRGLLRERSEDSESVSEILDNDESTDVDKLERLNELLLDSEPFPDCDYVEIGTPAKLTRFLEEVGWALVEIKKYGGLARNELLSDDMILDEIRSGGASKVRYTTEVEFNNRSNLKRVKKDIAQCLSDNRIWKNHILHIIDVICNDGRAQRGRLSVYNPMNIIYTLFLVTTRSDGVLYVPSYQLELDLGDERRMYLGFLSETRHGKLHLSDVFQQCFKNGENDFAFSLTWGGYNPNNVDICNVLGLKYKTYLFVRNVDGLKTFEYREFEFVPSATTNPIAEMNSYIGNNQEFVDEVYQWFEDHHAGGGIYTW